MGTKRCIKPLHLSCLTALQHSLFYQEDYLSIWARVSSVLAYNHRFIQVKNKNNKKPTTLSSKWENKFNKVLCRTQTRFVSHPERSGHEGLSRCCFLCSAESHTCSRRERHGLFMRSQVQHFPARPQFGGGRRRHAPESTHLIMKQELHLHRQRRSSPEVLNWNTKWRKFFTFGPNCEPTLFVEKIVLQIEQQTKFLLNLNMEQAKF